MSRRWGLVFSLALVAAACSGEAAPEGPDRSSGSEPGAGASFRLRDGALHGVRMTNEVAADGSAAPALRFTTDDTTLTALVSLGAEVDPGAAISISWYRLTAIDERELLLTHEIAVGPGGEAFSQGVSPSGISPGIYEIVATLGEAEVRLPWLVEVATVGERGRARSGEMIGALAQVGDEDWNVPDAGDSGWYGPTEPAGPPPPPGPCEIATLTPTFSPMRDVNAGVVWIGTCSSMKLEAMVTGPASTVASLAQIDPDTLPGLRASADVCELPGGSDLPGAVVRWTATGSDGATASDTFTIPDFGETLQALVQSVPDPGPVEQGQRIALRGMAVVMPTALGVQRLTLLVNGEPIREVGNVSETASPEACDDGRLGAITYTHYDVPEDPPSLIEICAHAVGFDGTEADHCIQFFTGQTWEAHGDLTSTVVYPKGSATCSDAVGFDATFAIGDDGAVSGTATATHVRETTCTFGTEGQQWETATMDVTGQREGDVITLILSPPEHHPINGIEFGGFLAALALSGGTGLTLTVTGTTASGPFDLSEESGNPPATYSFTGSVEATCRAAC